MPHDLRTVTHAPFEVWMERIEEVGGVYVFEGRRLVVRCGCTDNFVHEWGHTPTTEEP